MKKRHNNKRYLFSSERLGFRNWDEADIPKMIRISRNERVMEFFPALATAEQTTVFIQKQRALCHKKNYCYFAVDVLDQNEFIGFIGLCDQNFQASFTPCVDIGWRLHTDYWGSGLATEGAKASLDYGFSTLGIKQIYSTAPLVNQKSIRVMQKIGMYKLLEFKHPRLKNTPMLENCACYTLNKDEYLDEKDQT